MPLLPGTKVRPIHDLVVIVVGRGPVLLNSGGIFSHSEAESKEKHGVWDPVPELTITSPYVHSNTLTMGNPMPEFDLSPTPESTLSPQSGTLD